jgi:soluble lytic murein transglycosylase-like protein
VTTFGPGHRYEGATPLRRIVRAMTFFAIGVALAFVAAIVAGTSAEARAEAPPSSASKAPVRIPPVAALYRLKLEREVARVWGLDAPIAGIAAQIHQESRWRADAASPFAQGLMQFTPATAEWMGTLHDECYPVDTWDPDWSMRCGVRYDRWLYERAPGETECDRWAFTLADYNGGTRWRLRDQRLARAAGVDDDRWFGHVESFRSRGAPAHAENRGYVSRILLVLWPTYHRAGWPGAPVCPVPGA